MIWLLLVVFQIKHFLADYPLQNSYMLGKFKSGTAWIKPLAAHCAIHAVFTGYIASWVKPELSLPLALLDFVLHFIMDRIKASPSMLGQYKPLSEAAMKQIIYDESCGNITDSNEYAKRSNRNFWLSLGLDQGVHHLTHYLIIFLLLR